MKTPKPAPDGTSGIRLSGTLRGLSRCPHCGIAKPEMQYQWLDFVSRPGEVTGYTWATYRCTSCFQLVLVRSQRGQKNDTPVLEHVFPSIAELEREIPERARTYLAQAIESIHAPDGAAMLAGSSVDAMLKEKGLSEGSVYSRIDKAVEQGVLTKDMAQWAHDVRLGANRPRHADEKDPHVTSQEAAQAIEFAKTLAQVLFILPHRVKNARKTSEISKTLAEAQASSSSP
jgi:hypothetical protein